MSPLPLIYKYVWRKISPAFSAKVWTVKKGPDFVEKFVRNIDASTTEFYTFCPIEHVPRKWLLWVYHVAMKEIYYDDYWWRIFLISKKDFNKQKVTLNLHLCYDILL